MPKKKAKTVKRDLRRRSPTGLTKRELRFVEEYLLDLNGKQAAIRAGYAERSAKTTASALLKTHVVKAAVKAAMDLRSLRTGINHDRVLLENEILAFSSIDDYYVDKTGRVRVRKGVKPEAIRAVSKLKVKRTTREVGRSTITEDEFEFGLWDKPSTLKMAGRHVGLYPERLEVTGKNGRPIEVEAIRQESDEELKTRVQELLAKL